MTTTPGRNGLLLAAFGGPESAEQVMPFLRRVTAGRDIPDARLAAVARQYASVGGVSPLNQQTRELAAAIHEELRGQGVDVPLVIGYRNADPSFVDALTSLKAAGVTKVTAVVTSAYSSYSGCGQYRDELQSAAATVGGIAVVKAAPFYDRSGFREPFVDAARAARAQLGADSVLVCTAHSIPTAMADRCRYVAQLEATAAYIAEQAGFLSWELAYQSRSGSPAVPWLEPDVGETLARLANTGVQRVVVAPIGFLTDHMEVIYDLDQVALPEARRRGLKVERVGTPGCDPRVVTLLTSLFVDSLPGREDYEEANLDEITSVCGEGCCAPKEDFVPRLLASTTARPHVGKDGLSSTD